MSLLRIWTACLAMLVNGSCVSQELEKAREEVEELRETFRVQSEKWQEESREWQKQSEAWQTTATEVAKTFGSGLDPLGIKGMTEWQIRRIEDLEVARDRFKVALEKAQQLTHPSNKQLRLDIEEIRGDLDLRVWINDETNQVAQFNHRGIEGGQFWTPRYLYLNEQLGRSGLHTLYFERDSKPNDFHLKMRLVFVPDPRNEAAIMTLKAWDINHLSNENLLEPVSIWVRHVE